MESPKALPPTFSGTGTGTFTGAGPIQGHTLGPMFRMDAIAQALADPIRRDILRMLRDQPDER
jgi:hypothetical protein